ncbi:protein BIG GRAIN 1-like A [Euphorbia lathyris]|uniref:protein BIG GRAIN 1-like A n=1 Tax=Euphorbia lathyris TaxID=212925 RepID=UPI00331359B2
MNQNDIYSSAEYTLPQRRRTPSFSSSLLDAIYRSIDEGGDDEGFEETAMVKKQSINSVSTDENRALMIEISKEKRCRGGGGSSVHSKSTSSSDSSSRGGSCGGVFSSSSDDADSRNSRRISSIRDVYNQQKPKSEGGFSKTKLRAKKIYGELKKVKQPISPGGRIASFLNSIFSSGNGKKVKMCSIGAMDDVSTTERKSKSKSKSKSESACSSVASFSRSCLSKTPPSSNNGGKRSVRFYPVTVIVDEDSRPCGHKSIYEDDPGLFVPQKIGRNSKDVVNGERYIRHYQKKRISEFDFKGFHSYVDEIEDSDEDEDDKSCSSSDLFELDHLIGIGRFREELPVYETTNLKTNQAIANGFIL